MSLFLPLEDEDFWRDAMQADAEFRACMEKVIGELEVEIDVPALEVSFSLSASIDIRIGDLETQLAALTDGIPCVDIIIDFLTDRPEPDAVAFLSVMEARKVAHLAEKASIEGQLAVLPAFSVSTKDATDNLITSGKNASFLGGILDTLDP